MRKNCSSDLKISLPIDGKVIACDISEEYTREAVKRWNEAGVQDIVDLRKVSVAGAIRRSTIS